LIFASVLASSGSHLFHTSKQKNRTKAPITLNIVYKNNNILEKRLILGFGKQAIIYIFAGGIP